MPFQLGFSRHTLLTTKLGALLGLVVSFGIPSGALAQSAVPLVPVLDTEAVVVLGHYDNAVGSSDAASQGVITADLLKSRPALRPGDVLEFVPGMVVSQHSGDGKANQYYLRGFNLDHGTDFATTVNGLPVNMPTHAHGQGYSDINLIIPELVSRIDYRKGPYFAGSGNFSAAGSADIVYRTRLDAPIVSLGLGGEGFGRALLAGSTQLPNGMTLLGALEQTRNHGPWEVSERLRRTNGLVTLSSGTLAQGMSVSLMGFDSRWRATDQVPQRLLDAGTLNRFGTVDSSDAGSTARYSLSTQWRGGNALGPWRVSAYAMRYQLQLYSNFTYALNRPLDGDQILQEDARKVFGLNAQQTVFHTLAGLPARTQFGLQARHDRISVGLFETVQRTVQATTRRDRVRETAAALFVDTQVTWTPWLRTVAGVRADRMMAAVASEAQALNSGQSRGAQISPKFTAVLGPWAQTEFFVNAGRGFHSNDARGSTQTIDPATGAPVDKTKVFESSRGAEIGVRSEIIEGVQSSLALWRLHSTSELVFAGDSGTTEASRPSKRQGIEWNTRWTPSKWLLLDADFAWSRARFSDENLAGNAVPNAVNQVASLGATIKNLGPWSANLQGRYIGSAALIEDNSVRSKPSFLTSLRVARQFGSQVEMTLDVFNLFNRKVNDIEYYYASQLRGETALVLDRHVHPAQPRTLRLGLAVKL